MKHLSVMLILVTVLLLAFSMSSFGQSVEVNKPFIVPAESNEDAKAGLDQLAVRAGDDKTIIFIARLGSGERSHSLGRKRLHMALDYLQQTRALQAERLVTGVGDPVSGKGRIDVYLDNKLVMVFLFQRNKNFAREG